MQRSFWSAAVVALVASTTASAEVPAPRHAFNGDRLYLGGRTFEIGIAKNGGLGPSGPRPAGFRGTPFEGGIGLSADLDGYGTGVELLTDYFLPGVAEERWAAGFLDDEGIPLIASVAGRTTSSGDFTVAPLVDQSTGGHLQAMSSAVVGGRLSVRQTFSFDDADRQLRVRVTVQNVSDVDLADVRFLRSMDPDNSAFRGGSFTTENTVIAARRAGDAVDVVRAQTFLANDPLLLGYGSRAPLCFVTGDPRGRTSLVGFNSGDPWSPPAYDAPVAKDATRIGDDRIAVAFSFGTLAPGEDASAVFFLSLDPRSTDVLLAGWRDDDGDGVTNNVEVRLGTDPLVFGVADSDGDGLDDAAEAACGTEADDPDTDRDGTADGAEDADHDGFANADDDHCVTVDVPAGEGEGEGDVSEGEGEGEGEVPAEGEGEVPAEGEGEVPAEGEGEVPAEGEGEVPAEGEGEGEVPAEGEGEGEVPAEGEGEGDDQGDDENDDDQGEDENDDDQGEDGHGHGNGNDDDQGDDAPCDDDDQGEDEQSDGVDDVIAGEEGEGEGEDAVVGEGEGEGEDAVVGEGEDAVVGEGEGEGAVVGEGEGEGDVVSEGKPSPAHPALHAGNHAAEVTQQQPGGCASTPTMPVSAALILLVVRRRRR